MGSHNGIHHITFLVLKQQMFPETRIRSTKTKRQKTDPIQLRSSKNVGVSSENIVLLDVVSSHQDDLAPWEEYTVTYPEDFDPLSFYNADREIDERFRSGIEDKVREIVQSKNEAIQECRDLEKRIRESLVDPSTKLKELEDLDDNLAALGFDLEEFDLGFAVELWKYEELIAKSREFGKMKTRWEGRRIFVQLEGTLIHQLHSIKQLTFVGGRHS